jgi:hypothetical protein
MNRWIPTAATAWLAALLLTAIACNESEEDIACDGCAIGGVCFPNGVADPANPCRICDSTRSEVDWSDLDGASCDDGTYCNGTDHCSAGACNTHVGNPCGEGLVCNEGARQCQSACEGCLIAGACLLNGQRNPLNPCELCDASADATAFSAADGMSCDDGVFCNGADTCEGSNCAIHAGNPCDNGLTCNEAGRQCQNVCEGCVVEGVCLFGGQLNPQNECQLCDAASHSLVSATDCDDGLACNGQDTCVGGVCVHAGDPCGPAETCFEGPVAQCCNQAPVKACDGSGRVVEQDACGHELSVVMSCSDHGSTCLQGRCLCNPVTGTGCPSGHKCTSTGTRTECVPDGTIGLGQPCTPSGTDADECLAGLYCFEGACSELCTHQPDSCPDGYRCSGDLTTAFSDQNQMGTCVPICDPVAQDCLAVADACYMTMDGVGQCMPLEDDAVGLVQHHPCLDGSLEGTCDINGCDKGYGPFYPPNYCAFFCNPMDNWTGHVNGLSGDPAGVPCDAQFGGSRPNGPGPGYECRFIQSYYSNGEAIPPTVGMCVSAAEEGSCADFDLAQFVADYKNGVVFDAIYCENSPQNCMFSCVSIATLEAALQ